MSAFDFDVVTGPPHPPARSSREPDNAPPQAPAAPVPAAETPSPAADDPARS
jgi:hypothetical protein